MAGIPSGITTALVHLDAPISFIGEAGRIQATVTSNVPLVWAATGTPIGNFVDNVSLDPGIPLQLNLPHTDQPGFLDASGNAMTGWFYRIEVTYERDGQAIPFPSRDFQIVKGQKNVDLALIPGGKVTPPVTAPQGTVLDVGGFTGSVTLAKLGLHLVDNTPDVKKPVSDPVKEELAKKADIEGVTAALGTKASTSAMTAALANKAPLAYGDAEAPIFVRANGGRPVFTAGAQNPAPNAIAPTTSYSIYWPWIVDARKYLGTAALDEFYLYYSTDHEGIHGNSGIWLATGPSEAGPWTGRGRVFIDNTGGNQTETPSVVWSPAEKQFFMYYQQNGVPGSIGSQSTLLATSPDGVQWTRVGVVIDVQRSSIGDGHCGYFRPFRIGNRWYAYHLAGGANWATFALSYSDDGRKWFTDPNFLGYARDIIPDGRIMQWNHNDVFQWKGRTWTAGILANQVSGATAKDARLYAAPLSTKMRHLIARPTIQLYPTAGNETTNYRSTLAYVGRDGRLYFYYQCDNNFYLAIADGGQN